MASVKAHSTSSQDGDLVLMPTSCSEYLPPKLDSADEDDGKMNTGKKGGNTSRAKKGAKSIEAEEEDDSGAEEGSNLSESPDLYPFNRTDENSGDESSSSEEESGPQSVSEMELVVEKKVPHIRKPSKKAIETALNEVSQASDVSAEQCYSLPNESVLFFQKNRTPRQRLIKLWSIQPAQV